MALYLVQSLNSLFRVPYIGVELRREIWGEEGKVHDQELDYSLPGPFLIT